MSPVPHAKILQSLTCLICYVHAKSISLFQYLLPPALDEVVKSYSELLHALAQVVEVEVDGG